MHPTPAAAIILVLTFSFSFIAFKRRAFLQRCLLFPQDIARGRFDRLLLYGFVHADYSHLFFNLFSYFSIAFAIERLIGTTEFLLIYVGSLVVGALPAVFRNANNPHYKALGASGAIAGLYFSGMLFFPGSSIFIFLIPIPIPYPLFGVLFLVISSFGAKRSWGNIGHDIHLYGALTGLAITASLYPDRLFSFIDALIELL